MSGQESDPATLFRLYVDYGRYTEATELLLEYIDAYASVVSYLLQWDFSFSWFHCDACA